MKINRENIKIIFGYIFYIIFGILFYSSLFNTINLFSINFYLIVLFWPIFFLYEHLLLSLLTITALVFLFLVVIVLLDSDNDDYCI